MFSDRQLTGGGRVKKFGIPLLSALLIISNTFISEGAMADDCYECIPSQLQPPPLHGGSMESREPQTEPTSTPTEVTKNQRDTLQAPFTVQILTPVEVNAHTQKDEENQFKKGLNDWGIPIFTGVSTLIFLAQLLVFGLQARRLKETVVAMKEIDQGQSVKVAESIAQSTRAANAMKALSYTAKETAERQLRAYIFIENAWIKQVAGNHAWKIRYKLKNSGQTPASKVTVIDVAQGVAMPFSDLPFPRDSTYFGAMAPNGDFIDCVTEKIEFVSFADLTNELKALVLVGKITYEDAFGESRWTTFCFSATGHIPKDGEMDIHETGNGYY
jgi:hypothetical protein